VTCGRWIAYETGEGHLSFATIRTGRRRWKTVLGLAENARRL
jgi:hypothetical protein